MKIVTPNYYEKFSCIADKCSDSCCKNWQICFDEQTANKYLRDDGYVGAVAKKYMRGNKNGKYLALIGGNCPYLTQNGLCQVIIEKGEKFLCQVCSKHPRFSRELANTEYRYLSLSCPESAKLFVLASKNQKGILSQGCDEFNYLLDEIEEYYFEYFGENLDKTVNENTEKRVKVAFSNCEYIDKENKEKFCAFSKQNFEKGKAKINNFDNFTFNLFTYFSLVYYCGNRPYYMPALYSVLSVVALCEKYNEEKAIVDICKEIEHSTKNHKILYRKLFVR